jgi:UDP-glucose 4-epimerase
VDIVVTGGAGFIGSNLVRSLEEKGKAVRVIDDLSTGSLGNLEGTDVDLVVGDIRDPNVVRKAVAGVDVVYHLGALPSVARSVADPIRTDSVNTAGTVTILQAAREAGVRRVVYASSSSVYGDTPTLPKQEDAAPNPRSPYAVSKLAGEAYCRAFTHVFGLETVSLRFFNVFGPRQDPSSEYAAVIPRFITRMQAGDPPIVYGDGGQSRDFTFVGNAIRACLLAAEAPAASGAVMNVACGERITLLELVEELNRVLGTRVDPEFQAGRPGDVRHSLADVSRAGRLLNYRPEVSVRTGLRATVSWYADRAQQATAGVRS